MDPQKTGRRIKGFRKLKGYTQVDLANKINVSTSLIGKIERGKKQPSTEMIEKISKGLLISKNELIPIEGAGKE